MLEDIKTTLDIISPLVLLYAALRALWQLKLIQDQNSLTRESKAIDELREFEKFIQEFEKLNKLVKTRNTRNILLKISEMNDFNLTESSNQKYKENMRNWHQFYTNNDDLYELTTSCSNKLEIIATALNKGTAKLDIIMESIAPAFCSFVETYAYVFIRNRNDAITLYKNTINLYNILKPQVKSASEQLKLIVEETNRILASK